MNGGMGGGEGFNKSGGVGFFFQKIKWAGRLFGT